MIAPIPQKLNPILLTATQKLLANQAAEVDQVRIKNPFPNGMLVDEIRFQIPITFDISGPQSLTGFVYAKMSVNRYSLTPGFVPLQCFGKSLPYKFDTGGVATSAATWKLPKPLFLAGGEFIAMVLKYVPPMMANNVPWANAALTPTSLFVRVAIVGRSLPDGFPRPKKLNLPWVASWVPPVVPTGVNSSFLSTPGDLSNPNPEPLHVQRFIGHLLIPQVFGAAPYITEALGNSADINEMLTTVKITNHQGELCVRDNTPFGHLFQVIDNAWTINTLIPPNSYFLVDLAQNYSTLASGRDTQAQISMVGYREIQS